MSFRGRKRKVVLKFRILNLVSQAIIISAASELYSSMIAGFVRNFVPGKGYDTPEDCN